MFRKYLPLVKKKVTLLTFYVLRVAYSRMRRLIKYLFFISSCTSILCIIKNYNMCNVIVKVFQKIKKTSGESWDRGNLLCPNLLQTFFINKLTGAGVEPATHEVCLVALPTELSLS